jgi:signal transduction histidine kinase
VEICALTVFLGVRAVNLCQLAVSLPDGLRHTTAPALFVVVLAGYLVESVALAFVVVRARAYRDERWGRLDVGTAVLVLRVQPAFVAPQDTTGSWTAWGYACTLGSACGAAIVFRHRRATALAVLALSWGYLMGGLPTAPGPARSTVLANAFSYAGFAVLTRLLVGYLRRLGASAEDARRAAAEAAAEAARLREVERQRWLLHDNISVLRLLARTDLPVEVAEPLRSQATALANKVRTFLDDGAASPRRPAPQRSGAEIPHMTDSDRDDSGRDHGDGRDRELTALVHSAAEGFWDLRLVFNLDLAQGTMVPESTAAAVEAAVATLLHNARLHANADNVVVHADVDESAREWEITVRDDGQGFDTAATPLGFGLRVQVTDTLARHRIRVDLRSHPGDGTMVTLRGPLGGTP